MEKKGTGGIGLSYSRANEKCGKRIYYSDVLKVPRVHNYYSASGIVMEAMVSDPIQVIIDGGTDSGVSCRESGYKALDKMVSELSENDLAKINAEFNASVSGAEAYLEMIDYQPMRLQEKFSMRFEGMSRPTRGVVDLIANRGNEPVIIDFKRKGKKLSDYKMGQQDWRYQLALYCLWFMKARGLTEIPRAEIHVLIPGSAPQIVPININAEDIFHTVTRLQDLTWRLDAGYFPLNRHYPLCTSEWCPYYIRCHHEFFINTDKILEKVTDVAA